MPPLHIQVRLAPHHLVALDGARVVTDPASGLAVTLSRQQVLLGILDQWIAAQDREPHTVTETVTDPSQLRRMIMQEFEAFLDSRTALLKSIDQAQPVTDTVTVTSATDTVTDTDARQKPPRRRKSQAAPAD